MATYAIGDIQGCYAAFRALLELIGFNPERDRLWLVGDIVNRGPDSLNMLRFAMQADDSVAMVLGNHDLHLLMVHADIARSNNSDTIQPILDAEDCESMLSWLRHQRLFYAEDDYAMVHAGLLPGWSISRSLELPRKSSARCSGTTTARSLRDCMVMSLITGVTTGKIRNDCA